MQELIEQFKQMLQKLASNFTFEEICAVVVDDKDHNNVTAVLPALCEMFRNTDTRLACFVNSDESVTCGVSSNLDSETMAVMINGFIKQQASQGCCMQKFVIQMMLAIIATVPDVFAPKDFVPYIENAAKHRMSLDLMLLFTLMYGDYATREEGNSSFPLVIVSPRSTMATGNLGELTSQLTSLLDAFSKATGQDGPVTPSIN